MPPFRVGLLKRKNNIDISKQSNGENADGVLSECVELQVGGVLDAGDDPTDSEHERDSTDGDDHSDSDRDEVLFDDSEDSTLGDEVITGEGSDVSSDLSDSEAGDDGSEEAVDTGESADSGAESGRAGVGPDGDRSQDEVDSKTHKHNTKKQKVNVKSKTSKIQTMKQRNTKMDLLADKIKETSVGAQPAPIPVGNKDEYESGDTSDEEDRRTTVGAVPLWWYSEYPHLGYDLEGRRVMKPPQRDHIDDFLKRCEDPEFWRTVRDPSTGQDVVLSASDLELIARLRRRATPAPDADHDEYQPWVEWFSREVLATPVRAFPDHKRSFVPSRDEQRAVSRIVHALRTGWAKTRKQLAAERKHRKERKFYNLWGRAAGEEEEERARGERGPRAVPAPRRPPPTHAESYNPPPEYLLDAKEMKEWEALSETPWKRKYTFLPTRHSSLRAVPAYPRYVRERFLRCLDLYLAPRAIKMRLTITPEQLVPTLPSPRELQPFPTAEALRLRGHAAALHAVDCDPTGQYIVTGSDDCTVKVWESSTGRCVRTVEVGESVRAVAWTPVASLWVVAVAAGARVLLLNPADAAGAHRVARLTDQLLEQPPPQHDVQTEERVRTAAQWEEVSASGAEWARGVRVVVSHFRAVSGVAWHARGDYLCVTLRDAASRSVCVHQLSRRRSQLPFQRAKGLVQCALFHPHKPQLFVATQRVVRIYDLVKQELVKKLTTGAQWISALAVHPRGDNLLVASYDRKVMWFDLELSSAPYQTLRLHGSAVRTVAFHPRYPLFATAGDDRYAVVSHGMVYNDLLQNPLLVPLKQLRVEGAGAGGGGLHVLHARWHPAQPWLLLACADGTARLYA